MLVKEIYNEARKIFGHCDQPILLRWISDSVLMLAANTTGGSGTLLGIFEPDETEPRYRRIKLGHCGGWVRICYRRKSYELRSLEDRIFLTSRLALLMAMRATKAYGDGDVQNGNAYEANATRMLTERETSLTGPARSPIMVDDRNAQFDKYDFID